ncbi:uncharacterized protein ISCGN_029723 [Ixodes scapularis]
MDDGQESAKQAKRLQPRASAAQQEHLYSFMRDHPQITRAASDFTGGVTRESKEKLWRQLTAELNALGPATKSPARWRHYWTDKVSWAKKKAVDFRQSSGGTGGGSVPGEAGVVLDVVGHDASNDCGSVKLPGRPEGAPPPHSPESPPRVSVGEIPGTSGASRHQAAPPASRLLSPGNEGTTDTSVPRQSTTLAQCPVRAPRRRKRKGGHDAAEEYVQDQRRLVDLAEARAAASERHVESLLTEMRRQCSATERQAAAMERQAAAMERQAAAMEQQAAAMKQQAAAMQVPRALLLLVAMLATTFQHVVLVPSRPPTPPQLD